jgi:RimJ/RimL family protein N-acetyltransferase
VIPTWNRASESEGLARAAPPARARPYPRGMFRPRLPIATDRLVLRAWMTEDLDAFASQRANPDVVRYLYEDLVTSREDAARRLGELRSEASAQDEWINLAVVLVTSDVVIGTVGLVLRSEAHHQVELGYVFDLVHGGRGYATEAAAAMVTLAFDELGAHRVFARLDARNGPSARLAERLGFRLEAHLLENEFVKGEWCDELTYATLATEWAERGRSTETRPAVAGDPAVT